MYDMDIIEGIIKKYIEAINHYTLIINSIDKFSEAKSDLLYRRGGSYERIGDYKIDEAIKMLETAYSARSNDPYIIDSIGWAYYLIDDFLKAEKFLKRAVELMPDDPIVNDHYGDILWKLDRKIQARYFWSNVIKMEDAEKDMIEKINIKMIKGLES